MTKEKEMNKKSVGRIKEREKRGRLTAPVLVRVFVLLLFVVLLVLFVVLCCFSFLCRRHTEAKWN